MTAARAALIWAWVPAMVTVPVPSPVMVAPLPAVTVKMPLPGGRLRVVVRLGLSTSPTDRPLMVRPVSSGVLCGPGTVFTGTSFTGVTFTVTVAVSVTPPEVTV